MISAVKYVYINTDKSIRVIDFWWIYNGNYA